MLSAIRDDYESYYEYCSSRLEPILLFDDNWYAHWDSLKYKYNDHPRQRMKEREDHLRNDRFAPQD